MTGFAHIHVDLPADGTAGLFFAEDPAGRGDDLYHDLQERLDEGDPPAGELYERAQEGAARALELR